MDHKFTPPIPAKEAYLKSCQNALDKIGRSIEDYVKRGHLHGLVNNDLLHIDVAKCLIENGYWLQIDYQKNESFTDVSWDHKSH